MMEEWAPVASQPDVYVQGRIRKREGGWSVTLSYAHLSPEELTMAMLYRHEVEFAVGHGVAVSAETSLSNAQLASRLRTVVVPTVDVPQTTAPLASEIHLLADLTVDMKVRSLGLAR
jgi:hypothetical protein